MAARSIVLEKKCAEDSQVLRGSVSDDLIARKATLYLILCSMGSQCSCLRRRLACSILRNLRMSLAAGLCTCWSDLITVCG